MLVRIHIVREQYLGGYAGDRMHRDAPSARDCRIGCHPRYLRFRVAYSDGFHCRTGPVGKTVTIRKNSPECVLFAFRPRLRGDCLWLLRMPACSSRFGGNSSFVCLSEKTGRFREPFSWGGMCIFSAFFHRPEDRAACGMRILCGTKKGQINGAIYCPFEKKGLNLVLDPGMQIVRIVRNNDY